MIREWWERSYFEKYWLEVTGRDDLGMNLNSPQSNEQGKEFWSYSLMKYVQPNDIIFHYARDKQAIVARSTASSELWEDNVIWAARGTSARSAGVKPHTRPGWYIGLEDFSQLQQPVTLEDIRNEQATISDRLHQLVNKVGEPIYFPFEMGSRRPMRPMQGYLFKLPTFFVDHFPQLLEGVAHKSRSVVRESRPLLGSLYRPANETTSVGQRDPFTVDPSLVERALHSHASTQNALAEYLRQNGIEPRSPTPYEPNFDIAWMINSTTWVAEIKSLTEANEEKQLRLGLGQLLRYRQLLGISGDVRAVLITEREPTDLTWEALCQELGIILTWPATWHTRIRLV